MFLSVMLSISVMGAPPGPTPTPKSQCVASPGMVKYCGIDTVKYFVPSGLPKYLSFLLPTDARVTEISGVIEGYAVISEREANIPNSGVLFAPFNKLVNYGVNFAHPLLINGRPFCMRSQKNRESFCSTLPHLSGIAGFGVTRAARSSDVDLYDGATRQNYGDGH